MEKSSGKFPAKMEVYGKHVNMECSPNSCFHTLTTKKTFNIIIMVFWVDWVDTKYIFTLVEIKYTGRQSNASVYANNDIDYAMENDLLNVPQPSKLPQSKQIYFHMFPLRMTPLVWKITWWNKVILRSSKSCKITENVFVVVQVVFVS